MVQKQKETSVTPKHPADVVLYLRHPVMQALLTDTFGMAWRWKPEEID